MVGRNCNQQHQQQYHHHHQEYLRTLVRPSWLSDTCWPVTDLDIWRSANILLKWYGAESVFIATKRSDALLDQGDVEGCSDWVRIAKAISDLERNTACSGERVH
jgi:hypothetical protein